MADGLRLTLGVLTVVQARMGSTRLPGKTLMQLGHQTVLEHVLDRVEEADLGRTVVATTWSPEDDAIEKLALARGADVFRGHSTDVLRRFHHCQRKFGGEIVVRVTADCPFLDPQLLRDVAAALRVDGLDYAGVRGAPEGRHQEALTAAALKRSHLEATSAYDREHVVTWAMEHLNCVWLERPSEGPPVTLDTFADLERLRRMTA